jgi:hypothetical protein
MPPEMDVVRSGPLSNPFNIEGAPVNISGSIMTLPHAGVNLDDFDFRANLKADSATNETPGGSGYFRIGYHLDHDGFVQDLFVGFSKFHILYP